MNEFEKKGIEKFFRSKLKSSNQNNDWASPPDFIFEKAIDQVNAEEKEKNRKFILWLSLFGFVLLLSTIILTQSKQLNDVKKSLNKLEEELITSQSLHKSDHIATTQATNDSVNPSIENKSTNTGASIIENNLSSNASVQTQNTNQSIQNNSSSLLLSQSQTFNQSNSQTFSLQTTEPANEKANVGANSAYQFSPPSAHNTEQTSTGLFENPVNAQTSIMESQSLLLIHLMPISPLSHEGFNIEYSNLLTVPQFADNSENDLEDKRGFSIAIASGLNASTLLMDNMNDLNGKSLTDYDKYYSGIQSELSLHYHLTSRFSTGVHASYFKINNRSTFEESSSIDFANMKFVNGQMEYSMPMDIFTPIGSHKMDSEFIFDENLTTSNLIKNQSDIYQTINSLGIGVSARYSFIQKSKFNSFLGASFTHHLSNKTNSEFNTTITMEEKVMKKFKTIPDEITDNRKTFNSFSAKIGIEYKIAPKTKISFQSSFGRSLNSLRQTNIETDPQTHLQYVNTAIGISLSL